VYETRRIVFCDLDHTMTSGNRGTPTREELAARERAARWMFENAGVVFVTARTPELVMSSRLYRATLKRGYITRPEPLWITDEGGLRSYQPIETIPFFDWCYDPHGIGSFGSEIFVRRGDYSIPDAEYTARLIGWREKMLQQLRHPDLKGSIERVLDAIENSESYPARRVPVAPLEYRIQLVFEGESAAREKERIKRQLRALHKYLDFRLVDENTPPDRYVMYIVPRETTKERMIAHILRKMREEIPVADNISRKIEVIVIGDQIPDMRAGMVGVRDARGAFVVPRDSRIAPHLSPKGTRAGKPFAGENMSHFTNQLKETERPGYYNLLGTERVVIITDEAYPSTTLPPESVAAYLEDQRFILC
ncbi:MAG: hypothetical protein ACREGH_03215, partial [Minisyncoccia bacterium]